MGRERPDIGQVTQYWPYVMGMLHEPLQNDATTSCNCFSNHHLYTHTIREAHYSLSLFSF